MALVDSGNATTPYPKLKDLIAGMGGTSIYDQITGNVTVNANGKTLTFKNGAGQEYGLGGNQGGFNTVSDASKLRTALGFDSSGNTGLINGEYDSLVSALKSQIQQSINSKQQQINLLPQQYQPLKDQSEVQKANDLRTSLEQAANAGDRGGIGRQNALETQTAGDNRLNAINLDQKNAENALRNEIANLTLEGNVQEAQLSAQKLKDLIANNQWQQTFDLNKTGTELDNQVKAAQLKELTDPNSITNQMNRLGLDTAKFNYTQLSIEAKQKADQVASDLASGRMSRAEAQARIDEIKAQNDPKSLDYQYKQAQIDALQGKGSLTYKDYVTMGTDMLSKGNYDSVLKQYVKINTPDQVRAWAFGLPLTAGEIARLLNDLGIPKPQQ